MSETAQRTTWWLSCAHCYDFFKTLEEAKAHEGDCSTRGWPHAYRIEVFS